MVTLAAPRVKLGASAAEIMWRYRPVPRQCRFDAGADHPAKCVFAVDDENELSLAGLRGSGQLSPLLIAASSATRILLFLSQIPA